MLYIGLILGIIVLWLILKPKKENIVLDEEVQEEDDEKPCVELRKLAVLYKGKYLVNQEIVKVPYNTSVVFEVQGFDITGTKEACIDGNQVIWLKSCPCTHWTNPSGLVNSVLVDNNTKNLAREVRVKYSNGVAFAWKVEVV